MPKYSSLHEFLGTNKQLQCSVSGCRQKRVGMSQYCSKHRARAYTWGHPEAGAVKPHLYDQEIEEVKKLVDRNDEHEGIRFARSWLEKMMRLGAEGSSIRGAFYWANLDGQKISVNDLLIRLAALWLFERRDEIRRHIKNDKHATALTGHAVVRFGRMYGIKHIPPKIYQQVGDQIRKGIGPLLLNLCMSVEKSERLQQENQRRMTQDLNLN